MVGSGALVLLLATAPEAPAPTPVAIEPTPIDLTPRPPPDRPRPQIESRRGRPPAIDILQQAFGPAPQPDIAGTHDADEVQLTFREDGTVRAKVPRSVRGAVGTCVLDRCLTSRGIRSIRPRPEAPPRTHASTPGSELPTTQPLGQFVFVFGWQPASPRAAAARLRDTSDQRVAQSIAWQTRALEQSRRDVGRRLAAIVRDPSLSATEKREIVFELWDDAVATAALPVSDGDALGRARSVAARSIAEAIERFVRRAMPPGSELGYRASELRRLDATRRGPKRFSPYDDA